MTDPIVERREARWHLDKKIPLGLIVAAVVQAAALVGSYYKIVSDIELLKADVMTLHTRDNKVETDLREAVAEVKAQYIRLDMKLDRLIEKGHK